MKFVCASSSLIHPSGLTILVFFVACLTLLRRENEAIEVFNGKKVDWDFRDFKKREEQF